MLNFSKAKQLFRERERGEREEPRLLPRTCYPLNSLPLTGKCIISIVFKKVNENSSNYLNEMLETAPENKLSN